MEELGDTLKVVGPSLICQAFDTTGPAETAGATHLNVLGNTLLLILQREHLCQSEDLDDMEAMEGDEEAEQEQAEQDAVLMAGAANCVAALSLALGGATFVPYFARFLPLIAKYAHPKRSHSERSLAIGVLGECIAGLGDGVDPFVDTLLPLMLRTLRGQDEEEEDMRSNACFALGVLFEHATQDLTSLYMSVMQLMLGLVQQAGEADPEAPPNTNAIDNACGAICRMIKRAPHVLPLEQVLPGLTCHLPLRRDNAENEPVFACLMMLVQGQHPAVMPGLMPVVLEKMGLTLAAEPVGAVGAARVLSPAMRMELQRLLQQLQVQWPEWSGVLGQLTPQAAGALNALLPHGV
jgi:importin-4